jgi:carbohydrate kinase (thermoresistant glucokinase family)
MDIDVVVIAGISGSGKSTLAKMLATAQSWEFIEADDYHDDTAVNKMRNGIPLNDEDRIPWLLRLNHKLQQACPHTAGDNKTPRVLSCSALKEQYRNLLVGTLNARFVWLNISPDLASKRMTSRPGHYMPSSLAQSQLDIAEPPEHALILDAAQSPEILLRKTQCGITRLPKAETSI